MKLENLQEEIIKNGENIVCKPPERPEPSVYNTHAKIFLAGSIDQGQAEDWQQKVTDDLKEAGFKSLAIFNPRRDEWDETWEQSITNPNFYEQVDWEMDHLDKADVIVVYFDPKGKAPITLLELGLHAKDDKLIICCPEGYWRRGNVEMVADRYNHPLVDNYDDMLEHLKDELRRIQRT